MQAILDWSSWRVMTTCTQRSIVNDWIMGNVDWCIRYINLQMQDQWREWTIVDQFIMAWKSWYRLFDLNLYHFDYDKMCLLQTIVKATELTAWTFQDRPARKICSVKIIIFKFQTNIKSGKCLSQWAIVHNCWHIDRNNKWGEWSDSLTDITSKSWQKRSLKNVAIVYPGVTCHLEVPRLVTYPKNGMVIEIIMGKQTWNCQTTQQ